MVDQERLAYLRARGAVIKQQRREKLLEEKLTAQIGGEYQVVPGVDMMALFGSAGAFSLGRHEVDPDFLAGLHGVRFFTVWGYGTLGVLDQPDILATLVRTEEGFSFVSEDLKFVHDVDWPEHTDQWCEVASGLRTPVREHLALRRYLGWGPDDSNLRQTTDPFVKPGGRIVFTGDGITAGDASLKPDPAGRGWGYVSDLTIDPLSMWEVHRPAQPGDRVTDIRARWEREVLEAQPDVVSIQVGINDLRPKNHASPTPLADVIADYRDVLTSAREHSIAAVVMEPFADPAASTDDVVRELAPLRAAIAALAEEFDATFVSLQDRFTSADPVFGPLTTDGVHPTERGHQLIAGSWRTDAGALIARLG